jgi:hypothetical protein
LSTVAQRPQQAFRAWRAQRAGADGCGLEGQGRQDIAQLGAGQRLLHAAEHAQAVGPSHVLHRLLQGGLEGAGHHQRLRQPGAGDRGDELHAVHARHVEVDQKHLHRLRAGVKHRQRLLAAGRVETFPAAKVLQQAKRHAPLEPMVFHHQNRHAREIHASPPVPVPGNRPDAPGCGPVAIDSARTHSPFPPPRPHYDSLMPAARPPRLRHPGRLRALPNPLRA